MFQVASEWNPLQARLKEIILKKDKFSEVQELLLKLHSLVHTREVYQGQEKTYMDEIWESLSDGVFRTMPTVKDDTPAWDIWHITRIEDLTSNLLIANKNQVLNKAWLTRLGTRVTDTGNAMSDEEIMAFSKEIDRDALYEYRSSVGRSTKEIIENLKPEDMKRKADPLYINRILTEGGVTKQPESIWLLDFWGRKNMAGIFQMPITRHQIVHLNDCRRLINVCGKQEAKKQISFGELLSNQVN